jgi:hypothetical protein
MPVLAFRVNNSFKPCGCGAWQADKPRLGPVKSGPARHKGPDVLIFWKERLVFLANTKCGTTSIAMALESLAHVSVQRPPELKHLTAAQYHAHVAPLLASAGGGPFTTVALMREPLDWLGSWYRSRQRDAGDETPDGRVRFDRFAEDFLSSAPPGYAQLTTQAAFLADPAGAWLVDRVFRYEALGHLLAFLEDRLQCEIILPRVNVSPEGLTDPDAGLRTRLTERLALDYRLYRQLAP